MSNRLMRTIVHSPLVRLLAYFLVLVLVIGVAALWFPLLRDMLTLDPRNAVTTPGQLPDVGVQGDATIGRRAILGFLALLGGVAFVLPVAWIYTVTKRQEGYDKAFVQMLVILPIAVAGVVRVVRGDLALAFALAGIVAAVRFRTTLRDLKNAVFAFAAIGIGLASGTGSWILAGILALVFSVAALALWRYDIGGVKPELVRYAGPVRLSEALAPGETTRTVAVGNTALVAPLSSQQLDEVPQRARRLSHYIRADALRSKKKYDTLLLVYAAEPEVAKQTVGDLFDNYATRWQLVDSFPGRNDSTVLEYLMRLKKRAEIGEFLDRLNCAEGCPMRAAEIKPIKGLRKRLA